MVDYTLTGGGDHFADFTASAYKFDASSFYNWEQDNLPIWDLQDRTEFNYYNLGAGLSSVSGVTFTLSSTTDASLNVYASMDEIVKRLPKVCNFPVRVEIAKYGDLGELTLDSIDFRGTGVLIIDNLIYAKVNTGGAMTQVTAGGVYPDGNSRTAITAVSAVNGWPQQLSAMETINPAFSGVKPHSDASLSANFITVLDKQKTDLRNAGYNTHILCVDIADGTQTSFIGTDPNNFTFSHYDNTRDLSVSSGDVLHFARNGFDVNPASNIVMDNDLVYNWSLIHNTFQISQGLVYGNHFTSIKVRNCKGNQNSVIFRGVAVDGGEEFAALSSLTHNEDHGFDIDHSYVHLWDTAVLRTKKTGYLVNHSTVNVSGSMTAYRIYEPAWDGSDLVHSGIGGWCVDANNSTLAFPLSADNAQGENIMFTRSDNGMRLNNSRMVGGNRDDVAKTGGGTGTDEMVNIRIEDNIGEGLLVTNSLVELSAGLIIQSNGNGIKAESSVLKLDTFQITHNFNYGLELKSSTLEYGITQLQDPSEATFSLAQVTSYCCSYNNRNVFAKNSSIVPFRGPGDNTDLTAKLGLWGNANYVSYGANSLTTGYNSTNMILDNSYAEFVHFGAGTLAGGSTNPGSMKGVILQARNGSIVKFIGTAFADTQILGTSVFSGYGGGFHGAAGNLKYFQKMAGVAAVDQSTIEFSGPTKILFFGVATLADNQSTIRFGPQMTEDGFVEERYYALSDPDNHTKVHLHSTRSCIIADNNSTVKMEHMGDAEYAPSGGGTANFTEGLPYVSASSVSGGFFQFYPNPYIESNGGDPRYALTESVFTNLVQERTGFASSSIQMSATYGGMCARVLNGSNINMNHVNFPMGVEVESVSGTYYDASSTCWRPFIVNICDNRSAIKATNVLIDSSPDGSHGYHGPNGGWDLTGVDIDYYGVSGTRQAANEDGENRQNFGPFRLYFAPDTQYRNFAVSGSDDNDSGMALFSLAQGYLPSGIALSSVGGSNMYAYNYSLSAAGVAPSAFIYVGVSSVSSVLGGDGYLRNYLDETALNMFANAKHCTEDHVKMVGVIRESIDSTGVGEGSDHAVSHGAGIKSINTFELGKKN